MNSIPDAIRIYENIISLLDNGIFPGQYAQAISEARQFATGLIERMTSEQEAAQPTNGSDQPREDAAGVAGS